MGVGRWWDLHLLQCTLSFCGYGVAEGKRRFLQLARDGAVGQGKQGKKGKEERAGP